MKLLKCYIENFGMLHQKEYQFYDGFNMIYEPNGTGKTTLAMFIRSMFYGFPKDTKSNKDRKHYLPYNGLICGGYLDFEINQKQYRIQREFGKSNSNDRFALFDLKTKLKCNDYTSQIGEEIFHLDIHSFSNTLFHYQNDLNFETSETIDQRLQGMFDQVDQISVEDAIDALENFVLDYGENTKRSKKNSLKKLKELYQEKENNSFRLSKLMKEYGEIKARLDEYNESLAYNNEQKELYQNDIKKAYEQNSINQAKREYQRLHDQLLLITINDVPDLDENLLHVYTKLALSYYQKQDNVFELDEEEQKIISHFKQYPCHQDTFEKLSVMIQDYSRQMNIIPLSIVEKEQYSKYQQCFENLDLSKIKKIFKNAKRKQRKKTITIVLGTILLLISCFLSYFVSIYMISAGFISFIMILFGYFYYSNSKEIHYLQSKMNGIIDKEDDLDELRHEITHHFRLYENMIQRNQAENIEDHDSLICLYQQLGIDVNQDLILAYYQYSQLFETYQSLIIKEEQMKKDKEEFISLQDRLEFYFQENHLTIQDDYYTTLHQLEEKIEQNKTNQSYLLKLQKQMDELKLKYDHIDLMSKPLEDINIDELLERYHEFDNDQLNQSILNDQRLLEEYQTKIEEVTKEKEEAMHLQKKINVLSKKVQSITKAKMYLEKANQSFKIQYSSMIEETFMKYYHLLSSYDDSIQIDIDHVVYVQGKVATTLSAGYQDLIYLCMRFTMIELIFQTEKAMIIFDDPFTNLDDKKVYLGLQLLHEMANQYQIIYFTCHQSRK